MNTFQASCQRGHDRIGFTDRDAFERHMVGQHKAKRFRPGGAVPATMDRAAVGWTAAGFHAREWKAPRGNAASFDRIVRAAIQDGALTVETLTEAA